MDCIENYCSLKTWPEKREIYDRMGKKHSRKEWVLAVLPKTTLLTLFNLSLVGVAEGGGRDDGGEDVVHSFEVSLEDLYLGTSKKHSLTWNVICSMCNG